jgi:phosphoglycolate phosphatase
MAPARVVVWDLDGTLVESLEGIQASFEHALGGAALSPLAIGPPLLEMLAAALPEAGEEELDRVAAEFRAHYDHEGWRRTVCREGALETVAALAAAGVRQFVVTNKRAAPTASILRELGLMEHLEAAWSPDSRQPPFASKGEVLRALLAESGIDPAEAVYVGDDPRDRDAAAAAGVAFVGVAHGYGALEGDDLIESLAGLPARLGTS